MASIFEEAAFERNFSTDFVIQLSRDKPQSARNNDAESFTWVVFRRADDAELILHCYRYQLSKSQRKLLEFSHDSFIADLGTFPFLRFSHPQYILMQRADRRLRDLLYAIPHDIKMAETATIVHGVIQALQALAKGARLRYCSLDAANIYISRTGRVQLASFDKDQGVLAPEPLGPYNGDCQLVGELAESILSRKTRKSESFKNFLKRCKSCGDMEQLATHAWLEERGTNDELGRIVMVGVKYKLLQRSTIIRPKDALAGK